ncbi:MAG: efflux RND transporter periplasmic adaptor subunit [Magnetococcales bacterium]|nr:efflux RND transporter periplasmic adaptor subunit [Magnetococcales bacterium]
MDSPIRWKLIITLFLLIANPQILSAAEEYEELQEESANLRGVVLPVNQSKLGFTQSGVVIHRPLEGTVVKKGDVLARIDDSEAKLKMLKAKSSLASAVLALQQAVRENKKTALLIEKGIMSETAIVDGNDTVALAELGVKQAKVDVASAKWALDGCKLVAPFSGAVVVVNTNKGEWIGAGSPALELIDLSQLEVSMDASPLAAQDLRVGVKSNIFAEGKNVGWGEVRVILPMVDAASGLRRVIWTIHPKKGAVVAGRYVTLKLQ